MISFGVKLNGMNPSFFAKESHSRVLWYNNDVYLVILQFYLAMLDGLPVIIEPRKNVINAKPASRVQ